MINAELFANLSAKFPELKEIPAPQASANAPAHEGKPYRDPYLYVNCPANCWLELARLLKEDPKLNFDFLTMVTAVDYAKPGASEPVRIDVVYHLFSMQRRHRLVVKISVPREEARAIVPSVVSLWLTADWQEREVYDMYGVRFDGHPNLHRILMWDGFTGWPLRKDYVHIPDKYDD